MVVVAPTTRPARSGCPNNELSWAKGKARATWRIDRGHYGLIENIEIDMYPHTIQTTGLQSMDHRARGVISPRSEHILNNVSCEYGTLDFAVVFGECLAVAELNR